MNSVQIIGNLTRDPEIKATKGGKPVARLSIACNRNYVTQTGEKKQLTDYITVVVWNELAEAAGNQLRKGQRVFVEGRYSTRTYEKDNIRHYVTEVIANMIAIPIQSGSYSHENKEDYIEF
jgi:single-strand DNA-binding protein